jgi:phenylacetate-CoA ligase
MMPDLDRNSGILDQLESMTSDKRRAYQDNFLKKMVSHAYSSGTPLKSAMDAKGITPKDIATVDDLPKLPVTEKTDLADHQKAAPPFGGYVTVPISDLLRIHQSPGPIYDPVGKEHDYWRWKVALYAAGFRPGDLVINTFAYHLTPAGHMFEEGVSELGGVIIPTGVGNTETQAEILRDLKVTGYIGTPSFLMAILNKARDMGIGIPGDCRLEVAFLLAEMLPESMRKRFSDEFGPRTWAALPMNAPPSMECTSITTGLWKS